MDFVLRREIARCLMPSATMVDLADCAELAQALGAVEVARALRQVTAFIQGTTCQPFLVGAPETFTTNTAIEELRGLMAVDGHAVPADAASLPPDASPGRDDPGPPLLALLQKLLAAMEDGDVEQFSRHLPEAEGIARRITSLADDASRQSLLELAAVIASHHLNSFFRDHHVLRTPPFGSPAILMASARLRPGALGAYLSGVERLIRTPLDLFGIVELAAPGSDSVDHERWLVLLASSLGRDGRRDIVGQMAGRRMLVGLRGLLDVERSRSDGSHDILCAIRDTAVDLGELGLAIETQLAIVERSPRSAVEQIVAAELYGTGNRMEEAADALKAALDLEPGNEAATERMEALATDRFQRYHVNIGYGSTIRK